MVAFTSLRFTNLFVPASSGWICRKLFPRFRLSMHSQTSSWFRRRNADKAPLGCSGPELVGTATYSNHCCSAHKTGRLRGAWPNSSLRPLPIENRLDHAWEPSDVSHRMRPAHVRSTPLAGFEDEVFEPAILARFELLLRAVGLGDGDITGLLFRLPFCCLLWVGVVWVTTGWAG